MTAAIKAGSRSFSRACWRMMSSWRSGRVTSNSARSILSGSATSFPTSSPAPTARVTAMTRFKSVRRRRAPEGGRPREGAPPLREPWRPAGGRVVRLAAIVRLIWHRSRAGAPGDCELVDQLRKLGLEVLERTVVVDDMLGARGLLVLRKLACVALVD